MQQKDVINFKEFFKNVHAQTVELILMDIVKVEKLVRS